MASYKFPKKNRILKRRDFLAVQNKGEKLFSRYMTIFWCSQENKKRHVSRLGITVTKKCARKATDRNRVKRRLREITRCVILPNLSMPVEIVIAARSAAIEATFAVIRDDVIKLLKRKHLLKLNSG